MNNITYIADYKIRRYRKEKDNRQRIARYILMRFGNPPKGDFASLFNTKTDIGAVVGWLNKNQAGRNAEQSYQKMNQELLERYKKSLAEQP